MEQDLKKKSMLAGILVVGLVIGVTLNNSTKPSALSGSVNASDWKQVTLQDVSTGENFTMAELEKPVLVETFAVWCPTCTRQQVEIQKLHKRTNITSVSLDVDPNEDASKIRSHIQRNGFSWRYAISPIELTNMLRAKFGNSVANPPTAPVILVCENDSRRLPDGVKPVSTLQEEIEKGC